MPPNIDWKPAVQKYPDEKYSCKILIKRHNAVAGMLIDDGFREPAMHYDHASEYEAKVCAWRQIVALWKERDAE
jgi:hypothetical protein